MADLTAPESESLRVQKVGQAYRDKGYDVLIEPQGDQLPDFCEVFFYISTTSGRGLACLVGCGSGHPVHPKILKILIQTRGRGAFLPRDISGTINCFRDLDMCYIINFRTYDDINVPV